MLNYYRNPLNFLFFNESLIVCSLFSFGVDKVWKQGLAVDELFMRTCFLANLIKREEVLSKSISAKTRDVFDETLIFMQSQRLMLVKKDEAGVERVYLKSSGEASMLLIGSICWPLIDTYYMTTLFSLSLVKRKDVEEAKFSLDVQWVGETMFQEGKINYFESCNQMTINGAKAQLLEMGVLQKKSVYINLAPEYQKSEGEKRLEKLIETIGQYRNLPMSQRRTLEEFSVDGELRRKVFSDFPIMAKL
uniref:GPAT/DHAPAT C-terminal domain-containing protein n=1 Tax=Favella ehrenbergii TaxID=182087 RepID=A0A7S3MJR5_9SPIT|mmetsp:Transcript_41764/g.55029  ORF Transcript_41764/g.55029 Transcript_41764/m.55029 type:complete len:248 (+) Transcript_41764:2828-3571(+)